MQLTMMLPPLILILSLCLPLAFLLLLRNYNYSKKSPAHCLPPGPRPLPLIGNLHLLSPLPHRDVSLLSKLYGPILLLRLGSTPTVFICSPSLAEQVLRTHDAVFAYRPSAEAAEFLSYGLRAIAFTEYGANWRHARKLCVNHLMNLSKLDSYEFIRNEEIGRFIEGLKIASADRQVVDVTNKVRSLVADIVCRIVMGRTCMEESMDGAKFSKHIREVMRILGSFNLNDYLPMFKMFDLQGMRKQTRAVKVPIDKFLEKIIDEHVSLREQGKKQNDFVDMLLDSADDSDSEIKLDRASIKAIILDVFEGSLDTSPVTIEWAFVELLRHPETMKKLKEEIRNVVGMNRCVKESDLSKLTYLQMVVKESFRLHQPCPFLLHHNQKEFMLENYKIPAGSNVMICIWAMSRDPRLWGDAEEFIPERFQNDDVDVTGHDYRLLPFGSGRRGCPGMVFGMLVVPLILAQLVHCFDWELPGGMSPSELNMEEKFGIAMPRVEHLRAIPIYSLHDQKIYKV